MATFEDLKNLLKTGTHAGPVTEESIRTAEVTLGVHFPPSYRKFLTRYGAAVSTAFEIAGLFRNVNVDEPPLWTNVVTRTLQLRRTSGGLIPNEYIPISSDGGDYIFYLDTSRVNSDKECPVIVLGPGADVVVVADDFIDFVDRSLNRNLSF